MGARRTFLEDSQSSRIEAMENIEYGLSVASELVG